MKQLTSKKGNNNSVTAIKSSNGEVLTDGNEIKTRWKEYIETLYDKNGKPTVEQMGAKEEESNLQEDCVVGHSKKYFFVENELWGNQKGCSTPR